MIGSVGSPAGAAGSGATGVSRSDRRKSPPRIAARGVAVGRSGVPLLRRQRLAHLYPHDLARGVGLPADAHALDIIDIYSATGMRFSEGVALEWKHVKLDRSPPVVSVEERRIESETDKPKTRKARRSIPIWKRLAERVAEIKRE